MKLNECVYLLMRQRSVKEVNKKVRSVARNRTQSNTEQNGPLTVKIMAICESVSKTTGSKLVWYQKKGTTVFLDELPTFWYQEQEQRVSTSDDMAIGSAMVVLFVLPFFVVVWFFFFFFDVAVAAGLAKIFTICTPSRQKKTLVHSTCD